MYKTKWIIDPQEIKFLTKKDNLVCLIGTESEPRIGIRCLKEDNGWKVSAESKDGDCFKTVKANSQNIESIVNEMVDSLVEEHYDEWDDDEDFDDDDEYFCGNVFCDRYGMIFKPNLDKTNGDAICPSCGEPLMSSDDIEYIVPEDNASINYKDLAATILEVFFDNCIAFDMNGDDIFDELYEYNIREEEINELMKYHDIKMPEEYDLDFGAQYGNNIPITESV